VRARARARVRVCSPRTFARFVIEGQECGRTHEVTAGRQCGIRFRAAYRCVFTRVPIIGEKVRSKRLFINDTRVSRARRSIFGTVMHGMRCVRAYFLNAYRHVVSKILACRVRSPLEARKRALARYRCRGGPSPSRFLARGNLRAIYEAGRRSPGERTFPRYGHFFPFSAPRRERPPRSLLSLSLAGHARARSISYQRYRERFESSVR